MPVSSSCVFHFTNTKDALLGILRDNFKLSYCRERVLYGHGQSETYVPMVSFCDLPLSQVKDHILSYGSYGIGLSKAWAIKKGLSPVLYVEKDSLLAESYYSASKFFISSKTIEFAKKQEKGFKESIIAMIDILGYVKNYKADLIRIDGSIYKNYIFYNEREWRYVLKNDDYIWVKGAKTHNDPELWQDACGKIDDFRLEFEPNDIKFIIIKDEGEISEFVRHLQDSKGKFQFEDVQKVTTRIITLDQINNDL
jgi:hypothetical protein